MCWGVIVVPIKLAHIPGTVGIGIAMATGAAVMVCLAGREMLGVLGQPAPVLLRYLITGSLQFALGSMFYYESIRRGKMSVAVPITRIKVLIVLILSIALGLETFKWSLLGACGLVVMGGVLVGIDPGGSRGQGARWDHRASVILAMMTCVCWAAGETLIGTLPKEISALATNGVLLCCGLAVYCVYAGASGLWRQFRRLTPRDALAYVAHGIISFSIAYALFVRAIQIAGPARVNVVSSTYPLISAAIGWVAFRERFTWRIGLGAALLLGGVVVLQIASRA